MSASGGGTTTCMRTPPGSRRPPSWVFPFYAVDGWGREVFRHGTAETLAERSARLGAAALWWSGSTLPARTQVRIPGASMDRLTWKYWLNPGFLRSAGRTMATCTLQSLPGVLAGMAAEGHSRVFVKAAAPKVGVWTLELPPRCSADAAARVAASAIGTGLEDCGAEGFLVQGFVPFHLEMRFFVIGGLIREAVPVRRLDTVHERTPGPGRIDPRTCLAHDGAPAVHDRARAAAYARAAPPRDRRDS